jgi:Tol biopolymer transport system component
VIVLPTWAQQKCSALFADSETDKIVHELARLTMDGENSERQGNTPLAKGLRRDYLKKYKLAEEAHIDLSKLPQILNELRNENQEKRIVEETRRQKTDESEVVLNPFELTKTFKITERIDGSQFSPDGKIWAVLAQGQLRLYDLNKPDEFQTIPENVKYWSHFEFNHDGSLILASVYNDNGEVLVIDVATKTVAKRFHTGKKSFAFAHFNSDGKKMIFGSTTTQSVTKNSALDKDFLKVVDVASGQASLELELTSLTSGQINPDGTKITFTSIENNKRIAKVLDIATGKTLFSKAFDLDQYIESEFSPDGQTLMIDYHRKGGNGSFDIDQQLQLIETSHWRKIFESPTRWKPKFSLDGKKIVFAPGLKYLNVMDIETQTQISSIRHPQFKASKGFFQFNKDGDQIFLGFDDSTSDRVKVARWYHTLGTALDTLGYIDGAAYRFAVSPSDTVVGSNLQGHIHVWEKRP